MSTIQKILVFLFLLHCQLAVLDVPSENPTYDDDDDEDFTMLITGGYRPEKQTFAKYMVSIRTSRPTAYFGDNHFCAGTIVAQRRIVTAAHCIKDSMQIVTRPTRLVVVAGTPNRLKRTENTVELNVSLVKPHDKYKRNGRNDIAMLILKEDIPENNHQIKVIPLIDKTVQPGQVCTIIGWGQLFYNGPYSAEVVALDVTVSDPENCYRIYGRQYHYEGMLCSSKNGSTHEMNACGGDSGGPLICDNKLAGIVSWAFHCGEPGYPIVFSDVNHYRNWINSTPSEHSFYEALIFLTFIIMWQN